MRCLYLLIDEVLSTKESGPLALHPTPLAFFLVSLVCFAFISRYGSREIGIAVLCVVVKLSYSK